MNSIKICLLGIFLCASTALSAQKFISHAVKQGETLISISKEYKVTPYNILKYNKELVRGEPLVPNTILVIPVPGDDKAAAKAPVPTKPPPPVYQDRPESFKRHRVKRRETLFGISRLYNITVDDIKRYNTQLYSIPLKKGMRLRIPQYPVVRSKYVKAPDSTIIHTVQPKETRWSISHQYGITVDSLEVLNPGLDDSNDYLALGQQLRVPNPIKPGVEGQEVELYESYTVPAKMTLYRLGKEYNMTGEQIVRLNPIIMQQQGLKEGMVLRLPIRQPEEEVINIDNYIFYEVKPKQTIYSLTRVLGVTYEELKELNPEVVDGLKAGMVLKLPAEKSATLDVKNGLVLDKINLRDSVKLTAKPRLMVLLPFRLNRINVNDREKVREAMEQSNALKYSLGLYSGMLVALDSLASIGIDVSLKTFDTQLDKNRVESILYSQNIGDYSAIIGPLQSGLLKEVAARAFTYRVPVIAPLAADSDIPLGNIFFTVPSEKELRVKMLAYMKAQVEEQNIVVISDDENLDAKEAILKEFPSAQTIDIVKSEKDISLDLEKFSLMLSMERENWVFVETDNFKIASSVSSILNSSNNDETKVRMFTTYKSDAFENDVISGAHLSNLNFTYPSVDRKIGRDAFTRQYRNRWGKEPDRYAVRGFDVMYDLLLKLAYKNNLFEVSDAIGVTEYTANKFNFIKELASGYYNTASYIMMYDNMRVRQVN